MSDTIKALTEAVRGRVITPSDSDYDDARAVHNAMHDHRPRAAVRCADSADVMAAGAAARNGGVDLAIRGGGHSVPRFGTVENGLVIDLSRMNSVRVDPVKKIARVGGGATWGDVDHATYPFGLAAPGGVISTTGVGGLTLGGSIGYLGIWPDPADNEANIKWVKDYYAAIHPYSGGDGGYVNLMSSDDDHRAPANYGANCARLAAVKATYDPDNLFHINPNIAPANGS